eukprot:1602581-Amphidinium_carterae.1
MHGHQCPALVCWHNYKYQSCKRSPVCCERAQKVVRNPSSRGFPTAQADALFCEFMPDAQNDGPGWPALM